MYGDVSARRGGRRIAVAGTGSAHMTGGFIIIAAGDLMGILFFEAWLMTRRHFVAVYDIDRLIAAGIDETICGF